MDKETALGNGLWKGKKLSEMSRLELYEALADLGALYQTSLLEHLNK